MVKKINNSDGIDFSDVRRYAKMLGVNVVGKKKAKAVELVLDAVVADYEKSQGDLTKAEFQDYKKKNREVLDWYNKFKDWVPEPEAKEPKTEEPKIPDSINDHQTEKAEAKEEEKAEGKGKGKKDLSKAKGRVKEEKAEAAKRKAENATKPKKKGIGAFIMAGLASGDFKGKTNEQIVKVAVKKFSGNMKARHIAWYENKMKRDGIKIKR